MEAKEAVKTAKTHILDILGAESIIDTMLEEVKYDYDADEWLITISFRRPWDPPIKPDATPLEIFDSRTYKLVRIEDKTDKILSLSDRILHPVQ